MKIVSAVGEYGGGHAWLETGMPVHLAMRIVIERDAEKNCFLGVQGWQSQAVEIEPVPVIDARRSTALLLGPNVVDQLKDGDYVTISIPETSFNESDFWPPIPISGRKGQGAGFVGGAPAPQKPRMPPTQGSSSAKPPVADVVQPPPGIETGSQGTVESGTVRHGSGVLRIVGIAVAGIFALALLGVGGYFAWQKFPGEAIASLPGTAISAVQGAGQSLLGLGGHDAAYWNGVLRDPASTPEQLYNSALETRDDAETRGLSHEFLYQAASRGNGQAQQDYSRIYDPTITDTVGWDVRKNARTALEFYRKRQDTGDQNVTGDIQRVCEFLKPDIFVNADSRTAFNDYCAQ